AGEDAAPRDARGVARIQGSRVEADQGREGRPWLWPRPHNLSLPHACGEAVAKPILTEPRFDVIGVGLNATDTLILLPKFPAYAGKVPFEAEMLSPGGQVASALVTCSRLGLRVKYIGTVGDDERGRVQLASLRQTGINLDDVQVRANCANQTAYILIDQSTGERTVL